jgi:hypothetical protein
VPIPEGRLRGVVFGALRRDFGGQWLGLTQAVAWVATERGIYPALNDTRIVQIDPADEPRLRTLVEELMVEGVLELGVPGGAQIWPWLSLTPAGRELVARDAQPS